MLKPINSHQRGKCNGKNETFNLNLSQIRNQASSAKFMALERLPNRDGLECPPTDFPLPPAID
jgi:hypothetical protein